MNWAWIPWALDSLLFDVEDEFQIKFSRDPGPPFTPWQT